MDIWPLITTQSGRKAFEIWERVADVRFSNACYHRVADDAVPSSTC